MSFYPIFKLGLYNAWIFMSIFILQMLVMAFVNRKIWKKSFVPLQAKRNRFEKHAGEFANLFWFIALIYSIFLPLKLNTIWFYLGLIIYIGGLIILIRATYDFIITNPNRIIKTGAYRISRHPMYLATFLITLSISIASMSWLFFILIVLMMFFFYKEACIEERLCLEIFSNEYKEYLNHVQRWIGRKK